MCHDRVQPTIFAFYSPQPEIIGFAPEQDGVNRFQELQLVQVGVFIFFRGEIRKKIQLPVFVFHESIKRHPFFQYELSHGNSFLVDQN